MRAINNLIESFEFINTAFLLLKQFMRYSVVGSLASMIQLIVVVILVSILHCKPTASNLLGYACGFGFSYFGQKSWTFAGSSRSSSSLFALFVLISLVNFTVNQVGFCLLLYYFNIAYYFSLLCAMVMAAIVTFFLAKFIVFVK